MEGGPKAVISSVAIATLVLFATTALGRSFTSRPPRANRLAQQAQVRESAKVQEILPPLESETEEPETIVQVNAAERDVEENVEEDDLVPAIRNEHFTDQLEGNGSTDTENARLASIEDELLNSKPSPNSKPVKNEAPGKLSKPDNESMLDEFLNGEDEVAEVPAKNKGPDTARARLANAISEKSATKAQNALGESERNRLRILEAQQKAFEEQQERTIQENREYVKQIRELKKQLQSTDKEKETIKRQLAESRALQGNNAEELETLRQKADLTGALQSERDKLRKMVRSLNGTAEELEKEKSSRVSLEHDNSYLRKQVSEMEADLIGLEKELQNRPQSRGEEQRLRSEMDRLSRDFETLERQRADLQKKLQSVSKERDRLNEDSEDRERAIMACDRDVDGFKRDLLKRTKQVSELANRVQNMQRVNSENATLSEQVKECRALADDAAVEAKKVAQLHEEVARLKTELIQVKSQYLMERGGEARTSTRSRGRSAQDGRATGAQVRRPAPEADDDSPVVGEDELVSRDVLRNGAAEQGTEEASERPRANTKAGGSNPQLVPFGSVSIGQGKAQKGSQRPLNSSRPVAPQQQFVPKEEAEDRAFESVRKGLSRSGAPVGDDGAYYPE